MEIGPNVLTGMGAAPLQWSDLQHWQTLTGIELNPWEATTLHSLSRDWVGQSNKSRAENCPAPYVANPKANDDAVTAQFKQMFDAMKRKQAGGKKN